MAGARAACRFSGMRRYPEMVARIQRQVEHRWGFWSDLLRANGIEPPPGPEDEPAGAREIGA